MSRPEPGRGREAILRLRSVPTAPGTGSADDLTDRAGLPAAGGGSLWTGPVRGQGEPSPLAGVQPAQALVNPHFVQSAPQIDPTFFPSII